MFSRTPYTIFSWLTPWHLFQIWCGARFLMESLFWQPYIISVIWLHLGISGIFFSGPHGSSRKKIKVCIQAKGPTRPHLSPVSVALLPPWMGYFPIEVLHVHPAFKLPLPIYTSGWRESEALQEFSVLPRNATPCRQPGPKPRLFNQIRVSNDMCAVIGQCASQN